MTTGPGGLAARPPVPVSRTEPGVVALWVCPDDEPGAGLAATLARHWLDERETAHARRLCFERDRHRYLAAHVLARRVLALETGVPEGELRFRRSPRGRPSLTPPPTVPRSAADGVDFNLSHTDGCNALAVTRERRVGVDVERLGRLRGRDVDGVAESFAEPERRWLRGLSGEWRREGAVLRLWTLKEAYAKARGMGLGLPFDTFVFRLDERGGVLGFEAPDDDPEGRWQFLELRPYPDVLAAVAVEAGIAGAGRLRIRRGFPWRRSAAEERPLPEAVGPVSAARGESAGRTRGEEPEPPSPESGDRLRRLRIGGVRSCLGVPR